MNEKETEVPPMQTLYDRQTRLTEYGVKVKVVKE